MRRRLVGRCAREGRELYRKVEGSRLVFERVLGDARSGVVIDGLDGPGAEFIVLLSPAL